MGLTCKYTLAEESVPISQLDGKFIWSEFSKSQFIQSINSPVSIKRLSDYMASIDVHEFNCTDEAVLNFNKIVLETAKESVTFKFRRKHHKNKYKKSWMDQDCFSLRRSLKSLGRKVLNNPNNINLRKTFIKVRNDYNKLRKKKRAEYIKKITSQLEDTRNNNPKLFWKTLNDMKSPNKQTCNVKSISEWTDYFEQLYKPNDNELNFDEEIASFLSDESTSHDLDFPFTCKEIRQGLSRLKINKKEGIDSISNEMLKYGSSVLTLPLVKLFNFILNSTNFPVTWNMSLISTIYKKGDKNNCNNYRGISLSSCLSKLFTGLLQNRLITHLENNNFFSPFQAGFRPDHRTTDHIFAIKTIINKYVYKLKKPVYGCFVDFAKAFDSVSRNSLLYKLTNTKIGGNFYKLIRNMYSNTKFRFKKDDKLGPERTSYRGVKQGDGLSPLLFNIFINDLCDSFDEDCKPVFIEDIGINCLLYADDLLIISETEKGLQNCISILEQYCSRWKLEVNLDKTKVIIFNSRKKILINDIQYKNSSIEQVFNYQYLGVNISYTGNLKQASLDLSAKATKALFSMNSKIKEYSTMNIETLLKLFDSIIQPILTYASEIWISDYKIDLMNDKYPFELVHLKSCKFSLGVHNKTSNLATRCELNRLPVLISILKLMHSYYCRLVKLPSGRLLQKLYQTDKQLFRQGGKSWLTNIKHIEKLLGMQDLCNYSKDKFLDVLKTFYNKKIDNNLAHIKASSDSKLELFSTLYNSNIPCYLNMKSSKDKRSLITKFRLSCHTLNIETLRYCRPKVSRDRRFCPFCPESVESEEHFLLECKKYDSLRISNKFISETIHVLGKGVEAIKHILNPQNQQNSKNITNYINDALKVRKCSVNK